MSKLLIIALFLTVSLLGCAPPKQTPAVKYAATIPPLSMILFELAKGRAEVVTLLEGGASPHTFEPTPALAANAQNSKALFWVGKGLDPWAEKLENPNKIAMMDLIDAGSFLRNMESNESEPNDPHFWLDPVIVKSIVPKLTAKLCELDPEGRAVYEANASVLNAKLDRLDAVVQSILKPAKNRPIVLIHPSMQYMANRYGLRIVAVVEPSPGKEPTIAHLNDVIQKAKNAQAKTVFTEPQLPKKEAEQVANMAGLEVGMLDPVGGIEGRDTYEKLILYNAKELMSNL